MSNEFLRLIVRSSRICDQWSNVRQGRQERSFDQSCNAGSKLSYFLFSWRDLYLHFLEVGIQLGSSCQIAADTVPSWIRRHGISHAHLNESHCIPSVQMYKAINQGAKYHRIYYMIKWTSRIKLGVWITCWNAFVVDQHYLLSIQECY